MTLERSIATDRFGLGAKTGETVPDDVRGWLRQQLRAFDPAPQALASVPTSEEIGAAYADLRRLTRAARREGSSSTDLQEMNQEARREDRQAFARACRTRIAMAVDTNSDFPERLAHFWANHFAVSFERLPYRTFAADFEFRAIRPNIMGSFSDLLLSAAAHPAMLLYLDQTSSVGPDSPLARRINPRRRNREVGLNENFAREILELHTMGARSGYTQEDVTELARALTGWTVKGVGDGRLDRFFDGEDGSTEFVEELHQPGRRTVLGQTYPNTGREQAPAILRDLARRPETARSIARKLATHFISDDPPAEAVSRLERAFITGDGDLPALYHALIEEPAVWQSDRSKFRTPWDWLTASLRVTGIADDWRIPGGALRAFNMLGQPIWRPGSPAGWGDRMVDWASPGALISRVELANRFAQRRAVGVHPSRLAAQIMGDAIRPSTADAIASADSAESGLAVLLASPEFMRR